MSGFNTLIEQGFPPQAAYQIAFDTLARYGEEPCTRPQAAAHEAGHWIVGDTMGLGPYRWLKVFKRHGKWLGENRPVEDRAAHIVEEPGRYRRQAMQVIGGFMGEAMAGYFHPSSSIDERALYQAMSESLAQVHGGHPLAIHMTGCMVTAGIITERRHEFDLIRHHLERHPRMLRGQLERLSRPNQGPWMLRWEKIASAMPDKTIESVMEMLP